MKEIKNVMMNKSNRLNENKNYNMYKQRYVYDTFTDLA